MGEWTRVLNIFVRLLRQTRDTSCKWQAHCDWGMRQVSEQRSGMACRIKVHSFLKLLVTVGIGCVLGFLAVGLAICTETLKTWKNTTARGIIHDGAPHGIFRATLFHCGYSTVLILVGSCLVSLKHRPPGQQLCSRCLL